VSQDSHDFLATNAPHYANGLTGSTVTLSALYLLSHGVVKIVVVFALVQTQLCSYRPGASSD
jgi:uncharacterized membrane protein